MGADPGYHHLQQQNREARKCRVRQLHCEVRCSFRTGDLAKRPRHFAATIAVQRGGDKSEAGGDISGGGGNILTCDLTSDGGGQ